MDKGAHFFKCDFQVHTPRDINWKGAIAVTNDERNEYAETLVRACREKGLHAIAITDHHDFTFFPYIKKAASEELSDNGEVYAPEDQLIVFPGLELTLSSPPCQALLILDSSFSNTSFHGILSTLGITPNPDIEPHTSQVKPIPQTVAKNFNELYEKLNNLDYVKAKFIILPHVGDGGHKTLLRSGFCEYYKNMPCVGGYTESSFSNHGNGVKDIINGKDRNYGFKSIGLIQTSDNRKATHEDLGKYTTWIKWAKPTAEALRQACLAKDSRISQDIPVLPPIYITSLDVSNSKFLGRVYINLNCQYNAIIGGRGTGKSTILEYLRWCLCDQYSDLVMDEEELPNYQERRKKLIEKTLLPFDATVQVSFIKNGVSHIVRRKAKSEEILIKIGDRDFEICTEENIRNLLPIQAYSQKQLSNVGISGSELKRLVYSPIRQNLSELELKYSNLQTDIRTCYEKRTQYRLLELELSRNDLELRSVSVQVEKLRQDLKGISDEDRATIDMHEAYVVLEQLIERWESELNSASQSIKNVLFEVSHLPTIIPQDTIFPSGSEDIVRSIDNNVSSLFNEVKKQLNIIKEKVITLPKELVDNISKWHIFLQAHKQLYRSAKEHSSSQHEILNQITRLEDRAKELRGFINNKKILLNKIGNQKELFENLKEQWISIHQIRADIIESQCSQLSSLSNNNLRANLKRGNGTDNINSALRNILSGSNIRKEKIDSICSLIASSKNPFIEWQELLCEFENIALFNVESNNLESFPQTPKLNALGFSAIDLRKMSLKIDSKNFIELLLVQLDDVPIFEYRTREQEYIEFNDASAGQQATALLHILLNQEGPTLIIDQPEEDLDNQMVSDIAELIRNSKKKRQLIFTSHNANIVVNGDAELVACCDYSVSGDQSKGEIKHVGAIDMLEIRNDITKIMEGGEKAFKLRKDKYGF